MAAAFADNRRIGRAAYWQQFIGNVIIVAVLIFAAFATAISGGIAAALIPLILMAAAGIYFRVVMMRRCRDIGWPAFVPWAFFAGHFLLALFTGASIATISLASAVGSLAFTQIFALADFVVMIVIGCLPSTHPATLGFVPDGYYDISERPPARITSHPEAKTGDLQPPSTSSFSDQSEEDENARHDSAIARALADYKARQAASETPAIAPIEMPLPALRAVGFGRKGL